MGIYIDDIAGGKENIELSFANDVDDTKLPGFVEYESCSVLSSLDYEECCQTVPFPCTCSGSCNEDTCSCSLSYGFAYVNSCLSMEYMEPSGKPIVECSSLCSCSKMCPNRVVQHGIIFPLQVFKTDSKGFGVHSLVSIPKATFICEYAGEIICEAEAQRRMLNRKQNEPNYIFLLKEHSASHVIKTYVDPTYIGNIGRYINHSCSPNIYLVPVRIENMIPRLCFFSFTNIPPFTELCYDYGNRYSYNTNVLNSEKMCTESSCKRCFCGSLDCLGYLPHEPDIFCQ